MNLFRWENKRSIFLAIAVKWVGVAVSATFKISRWLLYSVSGSYISTPPQSKCSWGSSYADLLTQVFHTKYLKKIYNLTSILRRYYRAKHSKLFHPLGRSRPLRAAVLRLSPGLLDLFLMVMAAGAVSCQLTPDSLVISLSWWMTEMPLAPLFATTKMHPCLPPIWLSSLHCFSPHFHQRPQNSTHHIGSAADAEAKNETCVARHRCSTLYFRRAYVHLSFNLALILSLGDS